MKRLFVASMLLVAIGSAMAFAQEDQSSYGSMGGGYGGGTMQGGGGMMQGGGGMGGGMMQGGRGFMDHGHGRGPCLGCMVACASMVMPHLVATSDGGVVVAVGGKLVKYNANLRKVAETNIEIDWTQVQQRVQQIMQNCPMNRRMMMPQQRRQPQGPYQGQPQGPYQGQPQGQFQGQQ